VPQERTEAVVLRGVDFSETSRIVTFLTPARGRLSCIAKGARRRKSPLGPALDTFNRLELVYYWKDGRTVQQLAEASLLDSFDAIKTDLAKTTFAAFPLEIAYKVAPENDPSHALYAALVNGFEGLAAWGDEVRAHVCWQAWRLLAEAGYEPVLDRCVHCGAAVPDRPGFPNEGGVTCRACPADRRLDAKDYAALQALAGSTQACPRVDVPRSVFGLLRGYAARQVESDFRSVRVIEQMFGH